MSEQKDWKLGDLIIDGDGDLTMIISVLPLGFTLKVIVPRSSRFFNKTYFMHNKTEIKGIRHRNRLSNLKSRWSLS
jgi:hypothetical protein